MCAIEARAPPPPVVALVSCSREMHTDSGGGHTVDEGCADAASLKGVVVLLARHPTVCVCVSVSVSFSLALSLQSSSQARHNSILVALLYWSFYSGCVLWESDL